MDSDAVSGKVKLLVKLSQPSCSHEKKGFKRLKTSFRKHDILLNTTQRQDVVLKTILRLIRRFMIAKFNKVTSYIKAKRGREPSFYLEQLRVFVEYLAASPKLAPVR